MKTREKTNFVVYIAVNQINGKRYIGATTRGLYARRRTHIYNALVTQSRSCPRFYDALRKYGENSFKWSVLKTFRSKGEAFKYEHFIIKQLKPEYNVTEGGIGPVGLPAWNKIAVVCLETGSVFSSMEECASAIGSCSSEISESCCKFRTVKGMNFIKYQGPLTPEQRSSLLAKRFSARIVRRKRVAKPKHPNNSISNGRDATGRSAAGPMSIARKVICLDDGNEYPSAAAAARTYDVSRSAVIELCLGKNGRRTVGGRRFSYEITPVTGTIQ